ncbi:MAG: tyrosine-type recombinase/integrase [Flavobacteriales bacterium]|nr:tyrosine-type recombinase/integrase [Flavobacteriales bacterium]
MGFERFVDHLAHEKRASPLTVEAYTRDLRQFVGFLEANTGVSDLDKASGKEVRRWVMTLMENDVGARSVNRKLSALRAYYRFARVIGTVEVDPTAMVDPPKTPKRLPEYVDMPRMAALFEQVEWPAGAEGERDKLILEMLYGTGIRLAEILGVRPLDLDLQRGTMRVLGKRNKERILPLSNTLVDQIRCYLSVREAPMSGIAGEAPLLLDGRGEPLTRRRVQRLVQHYLGTVTTQRKRSPHVLRHTFATHLLEQGADLNAVKELLGHAGLAATQVYTHNTVEKLRKAHQQAHPRGGGPSKERPTNEKQEP